VVRNARHSPDLTLVAEVSQAITFESMAWECIFVTAGFCVVYEYVFADVDELKMNAAFEATLVLCPLILNVCRSITMTWSVLPIRVSTAELFPITYYFLHLEF